MSQLKDHRQIGKELDLFSFNEYAPGAVFWHPKGWFIYQQIVKLLRSMLDGRQYQEIKTPVMVRSELFKKSGHWQHFGQTNMFNLTLAEAENDMQASSIYSLKPMNCPESTLVFNARPRSYKELPLKFSEFGILHRNELSGVLGGLFRVREFTIDDAHIYCTQKQIQDVVGELLQQIQEFYKIFDFTLSFFLSTKPDKALDIAQMPTLWHDAEEDLTSALKKSGATFGTKDKDGAFYGPKIDFHMQDSQGRDWQLATIQLDFQMPRSLDVVYTDSDGAKKNAVMIHRAFTGSIERFIGILIEQYQGAFPLWLAPTQVVVIPVSDTYNTQAQLVGSSLQDAGIRYEADLDNKTVGAKIRTHTLQKVPYMCIIGEKEAKEMKIEKGKLINGVVAVRTREGTDAGVQTITEFTGNLRTYIEQKAT